MMTLYEDATEYHWLDYSTNDAKVVEEVEADDTEFKLYDFQLHDLAKLVKNDYAAIGSEMGVGKTHEAIALWEFWRIKDLPTLVVAPINTHKSWLDKFKLQAPEARVMVIDRKDRDEFIMSILRHDHDVYIVHWQALRLMPYLAKFEYGIIIGDEIHRISNREAKATVAFKQLKTNYKLAMSGTMTGDKPDQFWSILNWLDPTQFSSYWGFRQQFCIETTGYGGYRQIIGVQNIDVLHEKLEPFFVRHLKKQQCCPDHPNGVMPWLKEKTYDVIEVDLNAKQRRVYDEMDRAMVAWIGEQQDTPLVAAVVIAKLNRLNTIALATPRIDIVTKYRRNPMYDLYKQILDEEGEEGLKRAGFWSQRSGTVRHEPEIIEEKVQEVNLELPSSKIDAVKELVLDSNGKQFVIFSSSKKILYLAKQEFDKAGITCAVFSGDTSEKERQTIIPRFQSGEIQVFFGVIAAVGEGVDGLQHAADTMIFLDRSWSSKDNKQAEDRLHRGGQKNSVQIIDVVARDTRDAGRHQRLELKWSWIKQMLGDQRGII